MVQKNRYSRIWLIATATYIITLSALVLISNIVDIFLDHQSYSTIRYIVWGIIIVIYLLLLASNIMLLLSQKKQKYIKISILILSSQVFKFSLWGFSFDFTFGPEIYPYVSFSEVFKAGIGFNYWDLSYTLFFTNIDSNNWISVNLIAILVIVSYLRLRKYNEKQG